jgi:hypothetical protein
VRARPPLGAGVPTVRARPPLGAGVPTLRALIVAVLVGASLIGSSAWGHPPPAPPPAPATAAPSAGIATPSAPAPVPTTIRALMPAEAPLAPDKLAKPGRVRLEYKLGKGTATCDGEALFRKIFTAETAAADPFAPTGPAESIVEVRFENESPGFRTVVELRDLEGHVLLRREGLERTCMDASDRAMIVLLLTVFPSSAPPASPASSVSPPAAPPAGESGQGVTRRDFDDFRRSMEARLDAQDETIEGLREKNLALQKALDKERKSMDLTFALATGALITANLTSNVGPGVWFGGEGRFGPVSLGLEVRGVLPSPVVLGPYDFDVSQVVALLVPCGRYSYFFGCTVLGAGGEFHHDTYAGQDTMVSGPVLQIGGRLGVEVPFGDTMFGARAWGEVLYSAPKAGSFYSATATTPRLEWTRQDVAAFFGLGLVFKFGNEGAR